MPNTQDGQSDPGSSHHSPLLYILLQSKTFVRVKGKVQLGTYRLRSRDLEVSETFLDDVDALPIKYEKGQYFGFMEDYGTHYTRNGRAGGEYDFVYVLNSEVLTEKRKYKFLALNPYRNLIEKSNYLALIVNILIFLHSFSF